MATTILLALIIVLIVVLLLVAYQRKQTHNVFRDNIYLDNNGTTQPHKEVVQAMARASYYGNASAPYSNAAKLELKNLREKAAEWADAPLDQYQIIITSGASESNNLMLRSIVESWRITNTSLPHIILSAIEHKTSLECVKRMQDVGLCEFNLVMPLPDGTIDPQSVAEKIKPNTALISIMSGNNETGALLDIDGVSAVAQANGVPFHVDAVQTFGKKSPRMNERGISALSMSFHKMNGPMGLGLLILRRNLDLGSQIAGSQNEYMRGGTENVPAIAGAVRAMNITLKDRDSKNMRMQEMKDYVVNCLKSNLMVLDFNTFRGLDDESAEIIAKEEIQYTGDGARGKLDNPKGVIFLGPTLADGTPDPNRTNPNTVLVSFVTLVDIGKYKPYDRFCNIKLRSDLSTKNVILSIGSACNTNEKGASHVLHAMNAPFIVRCGVVRISLGDYNTMSEVKRFCGKLMDSLRNQ